MKRLHAVTKPKTEKEARFKPGEIIPESGVYCVEHQPHRLMHTATLTINSLFPRCKRCGDAVRFTLVRRLKDGRAVPFRSTAFLEAYSDEVDFPKAS